MNIKELLKKSKLNIDKEKIFYDEPMKKHTSFKVGGPAECLIKIDNLPDLKEIIEFTKNNKIELTVIGNGSNLLVLDGGIKGITLKINLSEYEIVKENEKIKVKLGAGVKMAFLGRVLLKEEIAGFEELTGIPGTVGGAVRMNAGAHGKEMKDIVAKVKCLDENGNEKTYKNEEIKFEYRKSIFKDKKEIITEVEIELAKGNQEEIQKKMDEYATYRKEKQPIEFPSAGSTFKRGTDFITAKLIDEAGLKGYSVGDAEVSTKHSGFVINKGNATAKDILTLVDKIKQEVQKKFNKEIELEIEVIGEE